MIHFEQKYINIKNRLRVLVKYKMVIFKKWIDLFKNFRLKNLSFIRRFIISYTIILVIPLSLTGVFLFSSITNMMTREIQDFTLRNIFQASDIIDMRLRELNHTAINLLQNPVILPLINSQDLNKLNEYDFYSLMRELRNYRYTNVLFDDIYIYFRNTDIIVGSGGKYQMSSFYKQAFRYRQTSLLELKTLLDNVSETLIKPVETVYIDNASKQILTYIMPIPGNGVDFKGTLVITVDASSLNRIIRNILGDNKGQVRVVDEKDRIIALAENEVSLADYDVKALLRQQSTIRERQIDGKKQMVFHQRSTQTGWSYLAVLPSNQILIRVTRMKLMSLLILIISMLIGGYLIYYFSYWNFNPIKHIFETISEFERPPLIQEEPQNELDIIETVMKTTLARNTDLEKCLKEQLPVIRADFLLSLLRGSYNDVNSIYKMCDFLKIKCLKGPFSVMEFVIDDYAEFIGHSLDSTGKLFEFSLVNVVEEICQDIGNGYAVNIADGKVALIIDFGNDNRNCIERMESIGERTIQFSERHFDFSLTIGIGRVYNKVTDIVKSYIDANTAVEYKMIMGKNKVIVYENIMITKRDRLYYPLQNETAIFNALKIGDYGAIRKVLTATIDNIKKEALDISIIRCIYFEIVNTAMKTLTELELDDYTEIIVQEDILPNLLRCETLNELYEQVVGFYKTICDKIQFTNATKELTFQTRLLDYIKNNYNDQNLSLAQLSEKFKVSSTYLSRFFSRRTQYNFVEYLHRIRLKKAKQLLENTNKNVSDIAIEVGYTDSHSLIRAFKKYENITPGKFREMKFTG